MRGKQREQRTLLMVGSLEERIPAEHPVRGIKALADRALAAVEPTFAAMYSRVGRPSVPPERLLKAQLLMALYSVRSDRQFCEQLNYNLLFRWFLDMEMDEEVFDASTFSQNRKRLLRHEVAEQFLAAVVLEAKKGHLLSAEHFTVDGTLIEAWASLKSFRPKDEPPGGDGNGWSDFRGSRRSNETHESKTDPEAKLMRKGNGQEARLCFSGHVLMENRNGLVLDLRVAQATGSAERLEGLEMLKTLAESARRRTVGADKGYDTKDFVASCREIRITPHVAQNQHARRTSAVDGRTTRHAGYDVSQVVRRRIESIFGWLKAYGGLRKSRFRGVARVQLAARIAAAAYNLLRLSRLLAPTLAT
jgi:transposase